MKLMEKLKKKEELNNLIERKKILIEKQKKQLEELEIKYTKLHELELPILLFSVDMIPVSSNYYKEVKLESQYLYIYYYPEFNKIETIIESSFPKLLPYTIDLRKQFERIGVPKSSIGNPYFNYIEEISDAALIIYRIINNILGNNYFNSWQEVRKYLDENMEVISFQIENGVNDILKTREGNNIKEKK